MCYICLTFCLCNWQVLDISEMLYNYFVTIQFGESELGFAGISPVSRVSLVV
jgi:hypothetical protein